MVTVPAPDQCPDSLRNGPSQPGTACPCVEMSNSPDASTAVLRQLAECFKEKKAMTFAFQFPSHSCRGPAIMTTLPRVAAVRMCVSARLGLPILAYGADDAPKGGLQNDVSGECNHDPPWLCFFTRASA